MGVAGLITAAGLSSRMGRFKPLLPLGRETILRQVMLTLRKAGADPVVVVTGLNGAAVEADLAGLDAVCVSNPRYAETQMLDSIQLGLGWLFGKCSRVLLTPGDVPLFSLDTVQSLLDSGEGLVRPTYGGKGGHPLLMPASLIPSILSYVGQGGLKGAILASGTPLADLPVEDPGAVLDVDTAEDYRRLLELYRPDGKDGSAIPDRATCMALLREECVPSHIVRHCTAVAEVALELAAAAPQLNCELIEAAALLHDIARLRPQHALAGAMLLSKRGYPALFEPVAYHMDLPESFTNSLTEVSLVFLADKLVQEDRRVTLERRFAKALSGPNQIRAQMVYHRAWKLQTLVQQALPGLF